MKKIKKGDPKNRQIFEDENLLILDNETLNTEINEDTNNDIISNINIDNNIITSNSSDINSEIDLINDSNNSSSNKSKFSFFNIFKIKKSQKIDESDEIDDFYKSLDISDEILNTKEDENPLEENEIIPEEIEQVEEIIPEEIEQVEEIIPEENTINSEEIDLEENEIAPEEEINLEEYFEKEDKEEKEKGLNIKSFFKKLFKKEELEIIPEEENLSQELEIIPEEIEQVEEIIPEEETEKKVVEEKEIEKLNENIEIIPEDEVINIKNSEEKFGKLVEEIIPEEIIPEEIIPEEINEIENIEEEIIDKNPEEIKLISNEEDINSSISVKSNNFFDISNNEKELDIGSEDTASIGSDNIVDVEENNEKEFENNEKDLIDADMDSNIESSLLNLNFSDDNGKNDEKIGIKIKTFFSNLSNNSFLNKILKKKESDSLDQEGRNLFENQNNPNAQPLNSESRTIISGETPNEDIFQELKNLSFENFDSEEDEEKRKMKKHPIYISYKITSTLALLSIIITILLSADMYLKTTEDNGVISSLPVCSYLAWSIDGYDNVDCKTIPMIVTSFEKEKTDLVKDIVSNLHVLLPRKLETDNIINSSEVQFIQEKTGDSRIYINKILKKFEEIRKMSPYKGEDIECNGYSLDETGEFETSCNVYGGSAFSNSVSMSSRITAIKFLENLQNKNNGFTVLNFPKTLSISKYFSSDGSIKGAFTTETSINLKLKFISNNNNL